MKRPDTKRTVKRTGDVRKDLTQTQLAWIGSVALAYNETEQLVDIILGIALSLSGMSHDVSSRINGVDGRVALIDLGLARLGCPDPITTTFADTLGNNDFCLLKKFRDRIMHATIVDAAAAVARAPASRGKFEEILLTDEALEAIYDRMVIIRLELVEIAKIATSFVLAKSPENYNLNSVAGRGVPMQQIESEILECFARYRRLQKERISLPPLPEFPPEPELNAADDRALRERRADIFATMGPLRRTGLFEHLLALLELPDLTDKLTKILNET